MDKLDKLISNFKAIKEELAKNVNGLYATPGNGSEMAMSESKFKEVQHKIEGQGHSADSAARITAAIGRKEIGQKAMTARSVAARKSEDTKMNKEEKKHQEGVKEKAATTWMPKQAIENLRCSDLGQWNLTKSNGKNPCQCHDCVQFGLSKHPEPKPTPITKGEPVAAAAKLVSPKPGDGKVEEARKAWNKKVLVGNQQPVTQPKIHLVPKK